MSCETHRQDALSKIIAVHPHKGLTAQDAERIYQEHKRQHPAATYESVGQLAGVVAQSGGALTLEEAQTVYDAAQAIGNSSAPSAKPGKKTSDPLADWIDGQGRTGIVGHEIVGRWQERIVPQGWHTDGEAGAEAYLKKYGKGIGADKAIALARQAEREGYPEMARGFWKKAYELKTGKPAPTSAAVEYTPPTNTPTPDEAQEAYCLKCGRKRRLTNAQAVWLSNGSAATKGKCADCGRAMQVMGRTPAHDSLPKPTKAAPQASPAEVAAAERATLELTHYAGTQHQALPLGHIETFMNTTDKFFEQLDRRYKPIKVSAQYRDFLKNGVPPSRLSISPTGEVIANTDGLADYACVTCGHEFWPRPPEQGQPKRCPECGAFPESYAAELANLTDDELRAGVVTLNFQSPVKPKQVAARLELIRAEIATRGYTADTVERWARGEAVLRAGPLMNALPEDQQAALRNELGEDYLVRAIRKYLVTPEHKQTLDGLNLSIEDVLNGRVPANQTPAIDHILREWNVAAGEDLFYPMGGQLAGMVASIEQNLGGTLTATPAGEVAVQLDKPAPLSGANGEQVAPMPVPAQPQAVPAPRPVNVGRLAPKKPSTPQEHILGAVKLPPPDPYRARVPAELGGALDKPVNLNTFVPPMSRQYEINDETEKALRTISAALQTGDPTLYNFYIAGEPGVGKNTLMRQIAACVQHIDAEGVTRQGIPYHQIDVVEQTNFDDLIGGTALVEENGVTVTRWKPGPVGAFLMHGTGVLAINEIVRQPKAATLLQSIMEDRELPIRTPDGGLVKVPIGDGIIIAMTGNPGSDRDPDRPGAAAFTRTIPIRMEDGQPEERARRAEINYLKRIGSRGVVEPKAKARPDVMQRDYGLKTDPLQKEELKAAVEFMDEIKQLIQSRQVQARTGGGQPVAPGPRGLDRFIALGKGTGDWRHALEMLKLYCSQDRELFTDEWKLVEAAFNRKFALNTDGSWKGGKVR